MTILLHVIGVIATLFVVNLLLPDAPLLELIFPFFNGFGNDSPALLDKLDSGTKLRVERLRARGI
jgi:hypothetical protein